MIAVDLRGIAQSTIPRNNDYTAKTLAEDLKGVLDFLKISKTYVYVSSHDQGGAPAAALSKKYPSLVQCVGTSQGREREYLAWDFFHASYSGNSVISNDHLDRYTREISKPGFLRSESEYYGVDTISKDGIFFKAALGSNPLTQPVLILGAEKQVLHQ